MELDKEEDNSLQLDLLCIDPDNSLSIRANAWISDPKSTEQHCKIEWPAEPNTNGYLGAQRLGNISKFINDPEKYLDDSKALTINFEVRKSLYIFLHLENCINILTLQIFLYKAIGAKEEILLADRKINNYFAALYDNEKFSDVTLSIGASEISSHRNILSGLVEI